MTKLTKFIMATVLPFALYGVWSLVSGGHEFYLEHRIMWERTNAMWPVVSEADQAMHPQKYAAARAQQQQQQTPPNGQSVQPEPTPTVKK